MPLSDSEQQQIRQLIAAVGGEANPSGWFESLYTQAQGNPDRIPWAYLHPHPYLIDWLDHCLPPGQDRTALVIGCGLGDDAETLAERGFHVTAFDISPTAIAWCQQRFPQSTVTYTVADLFQLDPTWRRHFDLVFECRTIQALPLSVRRDAIAAITPLVSQTGTLLVLTNYRETEAPPDGPPWPLSDQELAYFQQMGLQEVRRDHCFNPEQDTMIKLRVEYGWR
jgi:SAM-dependent methyltransferase